MDWLQQDASSNKSDRAINIVVVDWCQWYYKGGKWCTTSGAERN